MLATLLSILVIHPQSGVNPAFGEYRFFDIGSYDRMSFTRYVSSELGVDGNINPTKNEYWMNVSKRSIAKVRSTHGKDIIALKAWLDSSRVLSKLGEVPGIYHQVFPPEQKTSESEFLATEPYRVFVKVVLFEWVREKMLSIEGFKKIDPTGEASYERRTKFPTDRIYMTYRRSIWDDQGEGEFVNNRNWAKSIRADEATEAELALAIQNLRVGRDYGNGLYAQMPERVKPLLEKGLTRFPKSPALQYLLCAYLIGEKKVNAPQISSYLLNCDDYQWRKQRIDRARKAFR